MVDGPAFRLLHCERSYVYIVCKDTSCRGYYIRLKKSNGKVVKKVKSKYIYGESALGVFKGNLYVAHESEIYRFNKNGKFIYSSYYQYPEGRMTVKKNSIRVYFKYFRRSDVEDI